MKVSTFRTFMLESITKINRPDPDKRYTLCECLKYDALWIEDQNGETHISISGTPLTHKCSKCGKGDCAVGVVDILQQE